MYKRQAQGTPFFKEGAENGYLVKRADGRGVWQTDNWQAGMGLVDFTNPAACKWYSDKLKTLLDMGVDCFKTDFGERVPVDVEWFDEMCIRDRQKPIIPYPLHWRHREYT